MDNILIIDTETTGLNPEKGAICIEVGAILFSVKHKQPLQICSTLLRCLANEVEHINNISPSLTQLITNPSGMLSEIFMMATKANAIVAHNAQFDKKFIYTIDPFKVIGFSHKPWICTRNDFPWPALLSGRKLSDICNAMYVPYVDAHRALADCNLLMQCLQKVNDLEYRLESALHNMQQNAETFT